MRYGGIEEPADLYLEPSDTVRVIKEKIAQLAKEEGGNITKLPSADASKLRLFLADQYRESQMLQDDQYLRDFAPFNAAAAATELRDKIEITVITDQADHKEFTLNIARTTTFGAFKDIVSELFDGY